MERRTGELRRLHEVYAGRRRSGREDRYAPFEPANLFRLQGLERTLAHALRGAGLLPWGERTALDVGCGGGWWLRELLRWGARPDHLCGIDALPDAVAVARRVHPDLNVAAASADLLPFRDGSFDCVSQFTVFSSILDAALRRRAAAEMLRVLRPGGFVLWYDFTVNPTNRETRGIGRREATGYFAGCEVQVRRLTLAPPITRVVAPRSRLAAELLEAVPLLRTHLLMLARKP
ncbi:MAG: class I SAM-dependent methyltransferase [Dehalococcoidia bacterium]